MYIKSTKYTCPNCGRKGTMVRKPGEHNSQKYYSCTYCNHMTPQFILEDFYEQKKPVVVEGPGLMEQVAQHLERKKKEEKP